MKDLCILFPHHKKDDVTKHNLFLMKKYNPHDDVIPIHGFECDSLPESTNVSDVSLSLGFVKLMSSNPFWYFCDELLYKAFIKFPNYKRYIWLEWDTYCTQSVREAYADVWHSPAICKDFLNPIDNPTWGWWRDKCFIPDTELRGCAPMAGFMASNTAMCDIIDNLPRQHIFSELRLGTALYRAGINPTLFPEALRKTIGSTKRQPKNTPGIYHAVKTIIADTGTN
jgi:hypothetical protein